ncbi:POK7 protein, partial [Cisticola juncidis]|nr:POK7 protein [Cisticola juncidis]
HRCTETPCAGLLHFGTPHMIKTDNGPTYASKDFSNFLQEWKVEHHKGIPYSPTGQAVIERAHHT